MKQCCVRSLAGAGFLLVALTASAQDQPVQQYRSETQTTQTQITSDYARLFERIRTDLDHARDGTMLVSVERNRVNMARQQVDSCRRAIENGNYDRQTFDHAVDCIERVVDLNHLSDQNRGYLSGDIRDLTQLQAQLEGH